MNLLCCNVYVIIYETETKRASHLRASVRHNFNGKQMHTCKYLLGNKFPISGYCLFGQKLYFCLKY
ncbi:hypothetical protein M123_1191 [Bacteroides fragilis str. 3976T8]|uniref:Uncharacterized protein n=1 Tax=Bacteroides fragilis str. 3976T8 TaxID=1339314 RepID=A0A016ASA1_BACFG|nr:hypothetical protein M123_1191 [Bacteroides fragilis str. 3976T8]